jgi:hypothetical protein
MYCISRCLKLASRLCAVIATASNVLTLLRCCADTATTAAERSTAAFRLALIVLENEKGIVAGLEFGAHQGLIRSSVTPRTVLVSSIKLDTIERTNILVSIGTFAGSTSIGQVVGAEALFLCRKLGRADKEHEYVGNQQNYQS